MIHKKSLPPAVPSSLKDPWMLFKLALLIYFSWVFKTIKHLKTASILEHYIWGDLNVDSWAVLIHICFRVNYIFYSFEVRAVSFDDVGYP